MKYAVIENGIVVNVIIADASFVEIYYPGAVRIDDLDPAPAIGWSFTGGAFWAPVVTE